MHVVSSWLMLVDKTLFFLILLNHLVFRQEIPPFVV